MSCSTAPLRLVHPLTAGSYSQNPKIDFSCFMERSTEDFSGAEYTFDHLGFDKTYSDRVEFKYYESGHMAYLNQASAKQLKSDIANFIASTKKGGKVSQ